MTATTIPPLRERGNAGTREGDTHSNTDQNYYFIYISKRIGVPACARARVCATHPFPRSPIPPFPRPGDPGRASHGQGRP